MPEKDAFTEVYLTYSDKIFRFLYWQTRDPYLAEDLTSEVFLRAWQSWNRFDGNHLQAWLYRIAKNLLVDHWRKRQPVPLDAVPEPAYDARLAERLAQDHEIEQVSRALASLPEKMRTVVTFRFLEDWSCREVAELLGTSEGHVRVLQYRALRKLREVLEHGKHGTPKTGA